MAKNKNNSKGNASNSNKNTSSASSKNDSSSSSKSGNGSMKDLSAQFPDKRPARSGPGGE